MAIVSLFNHLVDFLVLPFHDLGPVAQLGLLSLLSAGALLLIFKRVSNQDKIKFHKDKIFGNFLEIAIYRDQFRRSITCQARVLRHNLMYLGAICLPLLLLMPPMLLVCLQLEYRLGYQALRPGAAFIIEARIDNEQAMDTAAIMDAITIHTSDTITMESPIMRIPATGQVFWQARLTSKGAPNFISISLPGGGEAVRKELAVSSLSGRFSPEKRKMRSLGDILATGEEPIPQASRLSAIRITYPPAEYRLLHWTFSPIVYYFILTLLGGLLLKPFIKVNL